jgi:hypothetical protein
VSLIGRLHTVGMERSRRLLRGSVGIRRPRIIRRESARTQLLIQQYITIRAELVAAVGAQHRVMAYALTGSAAIFTGLLTIWDQENIRVSVLAAAPFFLVFVWFIWIGEVLRMARAARFIWELEKLVNARRTDRDLVARGLHDTDLSAADVLHWETWVRGENQWSRNLHLGPSYVLCSLLLLGLAVSSAILANVYSAITPEVVFTVRALTFSVTPCFVATLASAGISLLRNPLMKRGAS